jgi:tetratricopeptide (TPR) repeat protein
MVGGGKMRKYSWLLASVGICLVLLGASSKALAQENLPEIVKRIAPSVVVITTYNENGEAIGQGSGFFVNKNGDIVTNRHVLEGANRAEVRIADGRIYAVTKIVAEDKEGDIIKVSTDIPSSAVSPLSMSSYIPEVGEGIVVIGSPMGLEATVSDGIVSAVRDIPGFGNIIQITAPISPGSSGSPVVNMKEEVIGIATFQFVEGQNLNFAIPGERLAKTKAGKGQTIAEWDSCTSREGLTSQEPFLIGLYYLWAEDYENALSYFKEALKRNPLDGEVQCFVGACYAELGRYYEAIESLKQAIQVRPDLADAHYCIGTVYLSLKRWGEAIESLKQAIRINPDYGEAHLVLGATYSELGRYDEAIECYKQAIRVDPFDTNAYFNLGTVYDELERYNDAITTYKQAIRIDPDLAEVHCNLGRAYLNLDRFAEAKESFMQAIRINPYQAEAHFNLGLIYVLLDDKGSALEEYEILKIIERDYAEELFNFIYQ